MLIRVNLALATSARRVTYERRSVEASHIAAHALLNVHPSLDRGAEVFHTAHKIVGVHVVGLDVAVA